ncbi:ribose-5-phosphate isomerase RpiA [Cucumibacter marinus]|uniref:ribose-5-phosphate isomerase RpiA n=1 Tax=Cucumibacter marinus TaxID=1121252 RepID=UPI00048DEF5A|nr:ribose-5-phosphate isomerase RpiA [Cucumibacter marinus]
MADSRKRQAAAAALEEIENGMRVGLGTGSTAWHLVDLLGAKVAKGFECLCVPTSEATGQQARALDIPLTTLNETPELDLTIDGADEIDLRLRLIKGGGGAHLREKIVAAASKRMVVIADESKKVDVLGRFPLPLEVDRFGHRATARHLETVLADFGAQGDLVVRGGIQTPFVTDGGHLIYDASFGRISDPEGLAEALSAVPGLVEHGLFVRLCKAAYIAGENGVEVLAAPTPEMK